MRTIVNDMPAQTRRLLLVTAALALFAAPVARAQDPVSPDPTRGSPSGTIYEIPVDSGRHDAAPRSKGSHGEQSTGSTTTPASGGGASAPEAQGDSPIHSDNGFGTSSVVPGATSPSTSTSASQAQGGRKQSRRSGASKRRAAKRKRAATKRDVSESQIPAGRKVTASAGSSPSLPRSYLLLALGVALGLVLAVAARLASRQR
jgi:hypothetical protein